MSIFSKKSAAHAKASFELFTKWQEMMENYTAEFEKHTSTVLASSPNASSDKKAVVFSYVYLLLRDNLRTSTNSLLKNYLEKANYSTPALKAALVVVDGSDEVAAVLSGVITEGQDGSLFDVLQDDQAAQFATQMVQSIEAIIKNLDTAQTTNVAEEQLAAVYKTIAQTLGVTSELPTTSTLRPDPKFSANPQASIDLLTSCLNEANQFATMHTQAVSKAVTNPQNDPTAFVSLLTPNQAQSAKVQEDINSKIAKYLQEFGINAGTMATLQKLQAQLDQVTKAQIIPTILVAVQLGPEVSKQLLSIMSMSDKPDPHTNQEQLEDTDSLPRKPKLRLIRSPRKNSKGPEID